MPSIQRAFVLLVAAACGFGLPEARAETLKIGGTGAAISVIRVLGEAFSRQHPHVEFDLPPSLGSGGGIRAVAAGAIDIGLSARPLKENETALGARAFAFARTPFVLVTSMDSRLTALSREGLGQVLTGSMAAWPDGSPVRLILRPSTDSDTRLLLRHFPEVEAGLKASRRQRGVVVADTDQAAVDLAERISGSLTTATLSIVLAEKRRVRPIEIDGVAPTLVNFDKGTYRMEKKFYLVTGPGTGALARKFLSFVYSDLAASLLRGVGCIQIPRPADE